MILAKAREWIQEEPISGDSVNVSLNHPCYCRQREDGTWEVKQALAHLHIKRDFERKFIALPFARVAVEIEMFIPDSTGMRMTDPIVVGTVLREVRYPDSAFDDKSGDVEFLYREEHLKKPFKEFIKHTEAID